MISTNFERDRRAQGLVDGAKVRVYWNFTRKCYSVQLQDFRPVREGKHTSRRNKQQPLDWRVASYAQDLVLRNVTFETSAAGRERVRRTKQKNVHSYVVGDLVGSLDWMDVFRKEETRQAAVICRYNPYENDSFVGGRWLDLAGNPTSEERDQISYRYWPIEGASVVGLLTAERKPTVLALEPKWGTK